MREEQRLSESWITNAEAWAGMIRDQGIESRRLATDAAILRRVAACAPRSVLDVGCGEGWLSRGLAAQGCEVVGIDGSAPLIERARTLGGATFLHVSYEQLAADPALAGGSFDLAVCNFALLHADLAPLFEALRQCVRDQGTLLIQTVHPFAAHADQPYRDGWRVEAFDGFGADFRAPMPWYFRTIGSWITTIVRSGWHIVGCEEPTHPVSMRPLSLLLVCRNLASGRSKA